jgi:hypothetical protein
VVGRDEQLVVRDEARGTVDDLGVVDEEPGAAEASPQLPADELVGVRTRHGHPEQEKPEQHCQLVCVTEPPQVRRQLR